MADTVKVKVLVVVDSDGNWAASGYPKAEWADLICCADSLNGKPENQFWLTAELAIPRIPEIAMQDSKVETHLTEVHPKDQRA